MKENTGNADRAIRTLAAIVLAILILTGTVTGTTAIVLGVLGAGLLLTSFVSFCPIYLPFNISTNKKTRA
jgi:hypothetical protein